MKARYIIYPVLVMIFATPFAKAQDIHFSQFSETPAYINPALAGVTYNTRVIGNYREQWSSVANKYQTMAVSFEQTLKFRKLKNNYFAIAANVFRDIAGDAKLGTLNPNLGISYLQRVSKKMKISGGIQGGFYFKTIDANNLRFDKQYDGYSYNPSLPSGEEPPRSGFAAFDLGGGINVNYVMNDKFLSAKNSAKFDAGISAFHYSIGKNSFLNSSEKLQTRMCGYFSGDFSIPNSINAIMPSFVYMRQGSSSEFVAGALFKFILGDPSTYTANKKPTAFSLGGFYRFKDAIIPTILFQYNKYAIGLSYDINVSALTPASKRQGALEVMLRYNVWPGYGVNLGRSDTRPSY
jgi:type IX secretion system PorP/SprF family membrane protein